VSANIDTSEENNESHTGIIRTSLTSRIHVRRVLLAPWGLTLRRKIPSRRRPQLLPKHGDKRARACVSRVQRRRSHLIPRRQALHRMQQALLLPPLRERHLGFQQKNALHRSLARPAFPAQRFERSSVTPSDERAVRVAKAVSANPATPSSPGRPPANRAAAWAESRASASIPDPTSRSGAASSRESTPLVAAAPPMRPASYGPS